MVTLSGRKLSHTASCMSLLTSRHYTSSFGAFNVFNPVLSRWLCRLHRVSLNWQVASGNGVMLRMIRWQCCTLYSVPVVMGSASLTLLVYVTYHCATKGV
jgi:hypothetical protein